LSPIVVHGGGAIGFGQGTLFELKIARTNKGSEEDSRLDWDTAFDGLFFIDADLNVRSPAVR